MRDFLQLPVLLLTHSSTEAISWHWSGYNHRVPAVLAKERIYRFDVTDGRNGSVFMREARAEAEEIRAALGPRGAPMGPMPADDGGALVVHDDSAGLMAGDQWPVVDGRGDIKEGDEFTISTENSAMSLVLATFA